MKNKIKFYSKLKERSDNWSLDSDCELTGADDCE